MSIEQRKIEVEQYIDHNKPFIITLIPTSYQKNNEKLYVQIYEDPFKIKRYLVTYTQFKEFIDKL